QPNPPAGGFVGVPPGTGFAPRPVVPDMSTPPSFVPPAAVPVPPNGAPPRAANPGAAVGAVAGQLRYPWTAGSQHHYQFTIEVGDGNEGERVTGSCQYIVGEKVAVDPNEDEGTGTGFVVTADGVLATCAHVVEGATNVEVEMGGRRLPATVMAVDPANDLALIRVQGHGFAPLPCGDSDSLRLAESVRVIGFPLSDVLGTGVKVNSGSLAGIVDDVREGKRLHVDAPINPGNSGGPVVDGSGRVIGIASAKLAGHSVTAVGFAVPVNALRSLMTQQGLQLPTAPVAAALPGTEVASRVVPSVGLIRVRGSAGGEANVVRYVATFTQMPKMPGFGRSMQMRMPQVSHGSGTIHVNQLGEIREVTGNEHLPYALGPVGAFFVEPLDGYSRAVWQTEKESELKRIQRDDSPFGRLGIGRPPRIPRPFGPRGLDPFGDPFGGGFGEPEENVVETIPAMERCTYQVGQELNGRVSISKSYEFTTLPNPDRPFMVLRGKGDFVFDRATGMTQKMDFRATLQTNNEDGHESVPLHISYQLRDPGEVKLEQEAAARQREERKAQEEQDRTVPNPQLVQSLLDEIRKAEGQSRSISQFNRLSQVAVVDAEQQNVLKVCRNHLQNSSSSVRNAAAEAFCHWATTAEAKTVAEILTTEDNTMFRARQQAIQRLAELQKADAAPAIIGVMKEGLLRSEAKAALIRIGADAEAAVLTGLDTVSDQFARRELLEVLQSIGTEKSIKALEAIRQSGDFLLKSSAERALDAIRARL
ncbi:MAG: trypsin-like peptidase domain-containing protein, partial [Planctomycetaceae bacterium]|nr:trypsin-like peptidase domain-containing protein [Planctomycetaceae bacterium]